MQITQAANLLQVIDKRRLAKYLFIVVLASGLLAAYLIHIDAFELFYDFSRHHEDWGLDEILIALIVALFSVNIAATLLVVQASEQLRRISADRLALERKLAHGAKLQALGNLLGGVAHSVNNHLLPIITLSTLVKNELPKDSQEAQDLEKVIAATNTARAMLRQVLNFARQEEIRDIEKGCQFGPSLLNAIELLKSSLPSKIRFLVDVQPVVESVRISAVNAEILLFNLVTNAVDAIEDNSGEIKVSLAACAPPAFQASKGTQTDLGGRWIRLSVRDSGRGMDAQERSHAFEPFYTTKPVGKGTGLGLSESYGLVQRAGGHIEVNSSPGEGTEISIFLPLVTNAPQPISN